ncbi:unnamed protein product [Didymodactylos carnosus]|nr:unnamed protein product [Didymodactylos carnosus]CAF4292371.1 unnamed protein product [Didymodactylos carnosus]
MKVAEVIGHIVEWIKDYQKANSSIKGFCVGVSGGIDSAVTSTLCAETGLPILLLEMPIHQAKDQVSRAREHINWLKEQYLDKVQSYEIDLTQTFDVIKTTLTHMQENKETELALANTRSRLRMVTLYYYAQLNGYVVVGTGNKVEDFGVGFFTKYGDGGVDISPIADLMKSEVRAVARKLGIIQSIIDAPPTDGLFGDSRTDEDQIGATYDELEWAMNYIDQKSEQILTERQKEVIGIYEQRQKVNHHKMVQIPTCILPAHLKT